MRKGPSYFKLIASVITSLTFLVGFAYAQASTDKSLLRLIGTVTGDITGAVLADSKGEQTFYRLRENLPDGSEIIKVYNDSVRVKQADGAVYEIYLNHNAKVAPTGADMSVAPVSVTNGASKRGSVPPTRRRLRRSSEKEE